MKMTAISIKDRNHLEIMEMLNKLESKERRIKRPRSVQMCDLKSSERFRITEEFEILPWKPNYWIDYETPLDEKQYHKRISKWRTPLKSHEKELHKKNENLYKPYQKSQLHN